VVGALLCFKRSIPLGFQSWRRVVSTLQPVKVGRLNELRPSQQFATG